jgi:transposase
MQRPEEMTLSRGEGEALIERLEGNALTAQDRQVLVQVLRWYFWLLFVVQEATMSLKRLRAMLFGAQPKQRHAPPAAPSSSPRERAGSARAADGPQTRGDRAPAAPAGHAGHGRWGAEVYGGAARVECRHEALAVGERCPVCGRGRLYRIAPGVDIRLDGHALLSAVRYVLEKLRCSTCGQLFTPPTILQPTFKESG